MQIFEIIFLLVAAAALTRLVAGSRHPYFTYCTIAAVGAVLLCLEGIFDGWRWQMYPAYVAFSVLLLASLKQGQTRLVWRLLGALPLAALVGVSALLAQFMPIVSLPAPTGPYGVGTFSFSTTDDARKERYAPERNRELFVEVWYPADMQQSANVPVRTLFQELYEGDYNRNSFMFGYLKQVDTHSHIEAPVARSSEGKYPVLLFNHAGDFGFTSQNQRLMEHLASHGYVIFSIAHPYASPKVNLAKAGTTYRASGLPRDMVLPRPELDTGIVGTILDATNSLGKISGIKSVLYPLSEQYVALTSKDSAGFLAQALKSSEFEPYRKWLNNELVEDFIFYEYLKDNSLVQYWVEDTQFIANSLSTLQAPVAGFSEILDIERLGVFGMSYGGAAAGEFCKVDRRCDAGVNMDGTQWGRHWNQKLQAPFLMLYHDGHQGGNDFAYLPPAADYWDYRIKGSLHSDFTDFVYLWPGMKHIGFSGGIDGMRMMEILNTVELGFFDHYLKGKSIPGELFTDIPEIVTRKFPSEGSRP